MRRILGRVAVVLLVWWVGSRLGAALNAMFGEAGGLVASLTLTGLGIALVLLARRWRVERPWAWWPIFGAPVATARMIMSWRATCEGLGLSVPAKRFSQYGLINSGPGGGRRRGNGLIVKGEPLKLVAPRRSGLRFGGCTLAVTVKLHPGQAPADWEKAAEAFAHQWRVHRVRAESRRPGFVTLTGLGFDPLRYPRPPAKPGTVAKAGAVLTKRTGPVLQRADFAVIPGVLVIPVGIREGGEVWRIDLTARAHHLVTGATRSGKSTLTVRLLAELCRSPVALIGVDAKNGMELMPFLPRLSALATTRGEAAAAFEAVLGVLYLRSMLCRDHGARSIWDLPVEVRPEPVVVVVDEVAELFLAADRDGKEEASRCVTALVRLGQLGAALGIHLWVAGQRFGSDLGPGATLLRAQLAGRICHRVADHETAVMTLAGLPSESVLEAQRIATDLAGVAVVGDDSGAWFLGRSNPLSMVEAGRIAETHSALAVPMPEVTAAIEAARPIGGAGSG